MSEWFRVNGWDFSITTADVVKETDKTITVRSKNLRGKDYEHRHAKVSDYGRYFPTRDDAVAYIRDRLEIKINSLTDQLEKAKKRLEELS